MLIESSPSWIPMKPSQIVQGKKDFNSYQILFHFVTLRGPSLNSWRY